MSWSVLQSVLGTVAASGNCTVTPTVNLSSGSKLIAVVSLDESINADPTSVKDAALNSFTMVASAPYPSTQGRISIWILDTPAGDVGAKPVITSTNNTNFGAVMVLMEVSGLLAGNTSAVLDGSAASATNTASPATGGAYSSAAANELLIAGVGDAGFSQTYTLTGFTAAGNTAANGQAELAVGYKNSAGGSETFSWAISGAANWGSLLVAFQLAAGPSAGTASQLQPGGPAYRRRYRRRQQAVPPPPPGVSIDNSTPASATLANGTHTAITSAAFSPPANSTILVVYGQEYSGSGNTQPTLTPSATGNTLSWVNGPAQWQASLNGYTAMYAAWNASAQSNITVTVTPSLSYTGGAKLQVLVLTGTDANSAAGGGSATWSGSSSTVENASVTTTVTGSLVAAGGIGIGTGVWTPTGGIATFGSVFVDPTPNNSAIAGTARVATPGTSAMGWTISPACLTNGAVWEIIPASGSVTASAGLAAATGSAGDASAAIQNAAVTPVLPQPGGKSFRRRYRRVQQTVPAVPATVPYVTGLASPTGTSYFVDQFGNPRLLVCDNPWSILAQAGTVGGGASQWQSDMDNYLVTRAGQGVNGVMVSPYGNGNNHCTFTDGRNINGDYPFASGSGNDPSSGFNNAFWVKIDHFLVKAQSLGITVLLNIGYDGGAGDFDAGGCLTGKTNQQYTDYGTALAARYASQPNIIWMVGNDYFGSYDAAFTLVLSALRAGGDTHLIAAHNMPESTSRFTLDTSSATAWGTAHADFNFCYSYDCEYLGIEYAYAEASPKTVFQGDGYFYQGNATYQGGTSFAFDRSVRQEHWWAIASGARGHVLGDEALWQWTAGAQAQAATGWFWVNNIGNIRTAVESLPGWQKLVPDTASALVTAGRGTRNTQFASGGGGGQYEPSAVNAFVAASITPDGTLALLYLPKSTTITVTESMVGGAGNYTATWVDPVSGATSAATTGTTYNSTAKGNNSKGDPDWVLVLQGPGPSANASANAGLAAATGTAKQPIAQVTALPGAAAATGTAFLPGAGRAPGAALATGAAQQALALVTVTDQTGALATGAALQPLAQGDIITVAPVLLQPGGESFRRRYRQAQQPQPSSLAQDASVTAGLASAAGTAYSASVAHPFTITMSVTNTFSADIALKVLVVTNVIEAGGASNGGTGFGAMSVSLNPVTTGSLPVLGLYNGSNSTLFTPLAGTTLLDNHAGSVAQADGYYSGTVTAGTPVTIGVSAPGSSWETIAAYELQKLGGTPAVDGTTPALATGSGSSVTSPSFTPPASGTVVLAAILMSMTTAPGTVTISDTSGLGLTWTKRADAQSSYEGNVTIFTATMPSGGATANAGLASATGAAGDAVYARVAGAAAATGAAQQATPQVTALPGVAAAVGTAPDVLPAVTAFDQTGALATGAALGPSVTAGGNTTASAGTAMASGAAFQPSVSVTCTAGLASATGAAYLAGAGRAPGTALATGAAQQAAAAITARAGLAPAAAAAQQPAVTAGGDVTVAAGLASATGAAYGAVYVVVSPVLTCSGFSTFPQVPPTAVILSVVANVVMHGSDASMAASTYELWDGTSARIDVRQGTASTAAAHRDSVVFTGMTYGQLATLQLRIYAASLPGNSGATASVDAASLSVNWVPNADTLVTPGTLAVTPALYEPSVSGVVNATVTPGVLGITPALPAVDPQGLVPANVFPVTLAVTPAFPAPAVSASVLITPGVLSVTPALPVVADVTLPNWTAAETTGGSWVNPANVIGPPDGSSATWTVPL